MGGKRRTSLQRRAHYEVEKELASRLRNAPRSERRRLYSSLYNELFRRVPFHPQLTRKASPEASLRAVSGQMRLLRRFLKRGITFLEVGPGDCALSREVAKFVKQVYAVDVSDEITKGLTLPPNVQVVLSDGYSIPVPPETVDVAYSNQLMEHLHQDDAFEQLQNVYKALKHGGVYVCVTPNRLTGPHDISRHFDTVATGFHLKEYAVSELDELFKKAGFSKTEVYIGASGVYLRTLPWLMILFERWLGSFPRSLQLPVAHSLPVRVLLGIRFVGIK